MTTLQQHEQIEEYIELFWQDHTYFRPDNVGANIGLPFPFVSPNNGIFKEQQFYWDTYFTILGLLDSGKLELARGMVDNLISLQSEFGLIPMRNRWYDTGVSQIPFLTAMIGEIFAVSQDKKWLARAVDAAERELHSYWLGGDQAWSHQTSTGLSRYCDHHVLDVTSEHESGWDMTSRFNSKCLSVLPIDLNSNLFRYESDLAYFFGLLGHDEKRLMYEGMRDARADRIRSLCWSSEKSCFVDYFFDTDQKSSFVSVASFYPLWSGLASKKEASVSVKRLLAELEAPGGLTNTQKHGLHLPFKQWDCPNGWPNQQYIAIDALRKYGFNDQAARLARNYCSLIEEVFASTGKVWEKYDVVERSVGRDGRYKTQTGFSWTCSVYLRLKKDYC